MKKYSKLLFALLLIAVCVLVKLGGSFIADAPAPSSQANDSLSSYALGAQSESDEDKPEASQAESSRAEYTFRSQKFFDDHYKKHGAEFGSITKQEYLAGANALILSENALKKTDEDGDLMFYDEANNEFAVLTTDGYIRTYFKPDSGIDYWNRQ